MRQLGLVLAVLAAVLIAIVLTFSRSAAPVEPEDSQRVTIKIPAGVNYGGGGFGRQLDISQDGKKIVYVGRPNGQGRRLYLQTIGEPMPAEIVGTKAANDPVFSPDGRYVVFYAEGNVTIADLEETPVKIIGKAPPPRGVSWLDADTLILGNTQGSLMRMSVSRGEFFLLKDLMGPQLPHLAPQVLPGNKAILFTLAQGAVLNARIGLISLKNGDEQRLLEENAFQPRYLSTGHIVFASGRDRHLMAVRFDPDKLEVIGSPMPILQDPLSGLGNSTDYAVSGTGTLVYTPRREDSIDDVLAHFSNVDLTEIHVRLNWFDELKRLVP